MSFNECTSSQSSFFFQMSDVSGVLNLYLLGCYAIFGQCVYRRELLTNKVIGQESCQHLKCIGVGRFTILGGPRFRILGGPRGAKFPAGT